MTLVANDIIRQFPGDKFILSPRKVITHSIRINAPARLIWPWLLQLGAGRAGWYSYDKIDNGGCQSATTIIPSLQRVQVGDIFPAAPGSADAFIVREIHPGKALVLVVPIQNSAEVPDPKKRMMGPLRVTWALILKDLGHQTELISRAHISADWLTPSPVADTSKRPILIERVYSVLAKMPWTIMAPIAMTGHYIMELRLLRGIKRRAEGSFKKSKGMVSLRS